MHRLCPARIEQCGKPGTLLSWPAATLDSCFSAVAGTRCCRYDAGV